MEKIAKLSREEKEIEEIIRKKQHRDRLIEASIEMLNTMHWDLWVTITFREERFVDSAKRGFKRFFKELNTPDKYYFKYIRCWVFYEIDDARDSIHIHALINGIDKSLASELEKKCFCRFGNSEVEAYDYNHKGSAIQYVAGKVDGYKLLHDDFYKINAKLRNRPKSYSKKFYEDDKNAEENTYAN